MRVVIINVYAFSQFLVASLKYRYENPQVRQKNSRLHKVAPIAPKIAEKPKSANRSSKCIRTKNSMNCYQSFLHMEGLVATPHEAQHHKRIRLNKHRWTESPSALSFISLFHR
jgi:hypothetical protein